MKKQKRHTVGMPLLFLEIVYSDSFWENISSLKLPPQSQCKTVALGLGSNYV